MYAHELDSRFDYHAPDGEKTIAHQVIRDHCKTLATILNILLPEGREKALAMTKLEEVMFWSNAAVARN